MKIRLLIVLIIVNSSAMRGASFPSSEGSAKASCVAGVCYSHFDWDSHFDSNQSNPHAAKSTQVTKELDERSMPLDEYERYMIDQGKYLLSSKEAIESALSAHLNRYETLMGQAIMEVLHSDAYEDKIAQVESMLLGQESLAQRYLRVDLYIEQGRYAEAQQLLADIPTDKVLDFRKDEEYADFQLCYDILLDMKMNSSSALSMIQEQSLEEILDKRSTRASAMAASLLHAYAGHAYYETLVAPAYLEGKSMREHHDLIPVRPSNMKLSPNPASDFLVVELKDAIAIARLEILDVKGILHRTELNINARPALVIHLKGLKAGTYFVRAISIEGEEMDTQQFQIMK